MRNEGPEQPPSAGALESEQARTVGPVRPDRPSLAGQPPAPVSGRSAVPDGVQRTFTVWQVALSLSFFACVTMLLTRRTLANHLKESLLARDPTFSTDTLNTATIRIALAVVAALAVVLAVELVFVRLLRAGRSWPRFAVVPVLLLHLLVALLASLLVPVDLWQGWLLTATLYLGALAAGIATVRGVLPSFSAWLRDAAEHREVS